MIIKNNALNIFKNMSLPYSRLFCEPFTPPILSPRPQREPRDSLKTNKPQINNKLAGIGRPTKGGKEIGCKPKTVLHLSLRSLNIHLHAHLRQVPIRSMQHVLITLQCEKHLVTQECNQLIFSGGAK